jgi:hypothetical protein
MYCMYCTQYLTEDRTGIEYAGRLECCRDRKLHREMTEGERCPWSPSKHCPSVVKQYNCAIAGASVQVPLQVMLQVSICVSRLEVSRGEDTDRAANIIKFYICLFVSRQLY